MGVKEREPKIIQRLVVSSNFSARFGLPIGRRINALITVDRGTSTYFVTGDSHGGICVFQRNGTLKGRARVTEDANGIVGLHRGQGQTVLFFSAFAFGFFSVSQLDVQYPPCGGWSTPLHSIGVDPTLQYARVLVSLVDGNVLVFATVRGKSKACDLTNKFPHLVTMPYQMHVMRGHVLALPIQVESSQVVEKPLLREMFFFNLASLETSFTQDPSSMVTLQVSFEPRQPDAFTVAPAGAVAAHHSFAHGGAGPGGGSRVQVALRFEGSPGVELFDLSLKHAPERRLDGDNEVFVDTDDDGWGDDAEQKDSSFFGWLSWLESYFSGSPKVGVFGVAVAGVVIWNIRKSRGGGAELDEDTIREHIRAFERSTGQKVSGSPYSSDSTGASGRNSAPTSNTNLNYDDDE